LSYTPVKVYSLLSVRNLYTIYHLTFKSDYIFPGESHNFWELDYFIDGEAGITSGDKIYECRKGDMVVHRPNVFHTAWSYSPYPYEVFTISFDGSGFENIMSGGKIKLNTNEIYNINCIIEEIPAMFEGYDVNEYAQLNSTSAPDDIGYQIIKSHLELLCLSIGRRGTEAVGEASQTNKSMRYSEIVSYMKENIERNLTVEEICHDIYETPGTLKSIFKLYTGGGIMKYFNLLRCEHCIRLIRSGLTIKEIADRMNFSSQFYLTYFVKRETGFTPSSFKSIT
jgi:AraC-like DNA-binding protein/mannose-6-phosphate isomerase-like protein (cupin superfamily)